MLSDIKFFFKTIISYPTSDEFDPKTLKIKIPVCTYITCQLCEEQYIKEHHKSCPCLNPDDKD